MYTLTIHYTESATGDVEQFSAYVKAITPKSIKEELIKHFNAAADSAEPTYSAEDFNTVQLMKNRDSYGFMVAVNCPSYAAHFIISGIIYVVEVPARTLATRFDNPGKCPADYEAIAMWGRRMGSFPYYIKQQQELAFREKAPLDAIYERNGVWNRVSSMPANHDFRVAFEATHP